MIVIALVDSCESDEYEIRVEKKTLLYASEESYQITYNNILLAESEPFTNNAVRSYYHCIKKYSDGMYTLVMKDRYTLFTFVMYSAGDSWSLGAYIRILGPDGQLVYLGFMTEDSLEDHTFACELCVNPSIYSTISHRNALLLEVACWKSTLLGLDPSQL